MFRWVFALVVVMVPGDVSAEMPLSVKVVNLAGLESRDLAEGLSVAAALYKGAGITMTWELCRPCDAPVASGTLWLRLATSPRADSARLGEAALNPITGAGVVATVYVDRVSRVAIEAGRRVERFLGVTIAHELGHLVIGSLTHGRHTGIMRPAWSVTDLRSAPHFAFTPRERADLRMGLSQREASDQP